MQENLKEALDELLRRERVLDQLKQFTDNTGHLTSKRIAPPSGYFHNLFLVENGRNLFVSTRGPLFRLVLKFRLTSPLPIGFIDRHRTGNFHLKTIFSQTWWDMFLLKRQVRPTNKKKYGSLALFHWSSPFSLMSPFSHQCHHCILMKSPLNCVIGYFQLKLIIHLPVHKDC